MDEMENGRRDWYALQVHTGSEEDVALRVLGTDGVSSLLPMERYVSRAGREMRRALMPSYVFVRCRMTPARWQALRHERDVTRILGDPYEAIPPEQMANVLALYWHGVNGTRAARRDGVTRIVGGPLLSVPHAVVRADPREGRVTVRLDLPGGAREVTLCAAFVREERDNQDNRD